MMKKDFHRSEKAFSSRWKKFFTPMEKEENHEHRPAERYGRKRQCTETPHHRVIEQLHDHLPDLRKHDGNGQRKVLTVLGQPAPQSSQKSHTKKSRHLRREAKDTVFRP